MNTTNNEIISVILSGIILSVTLFVVSRIGSLTEERKSLIGQLGCFSIFLTLCWASFLWARGDTPTLIFIRILFGYVMDGIIAVFAYTFFFVIFEAPKGVRKILAVLTFIGLSIFVLDRINARFGWGWNFPDIFGVVSGILMLVYFLSGKYLVKDKAG